MLSAVPVSRRSRARQVSFDLNSFTNRNPCDQYRRRKTQSGFVRLSRLAPGNLRQLSVKTGFSCLGRDERFANGSTVCRL